MNYSEQFVITKNGYNDYTIIRKTTGKVQKPLNSTTYHKYGNNKTYQVLNVINTSGKHTTAPIHRILYEYYIGVIPEGYDIDHINGDSLDNDITNLQILTRKENLEKARKEKGLYKTKNILTEEERAEKEKEALEREQIKILKQQYNQNKEEYKKQGILQRDYINMNRS